MAQLTVKVIIQQLTGGWRKLHNEDLRDLYASQNTKNQGDGLGM
jgi:hypothetical protein